MKRALIISFVALSACGRDELREDQLAVQPQQQSLVGTYEFGPMVGKGLPPSDDSVSPSSRLASLELKADGTFEMNFGMGCVINFASGTWKKLGGATAQLQLSQYSAWTDARGNRVKTTSLIAVLTDDGLAIAGESINQNWEVAR